MAWNEQNDPANPGVVGGAAGPDLSAGAVPFSGRATDMRSSYPPNAMAPNGYPAASPDLMPQPNVEPNYLPPQYGSEAPLSQSPTYGTEQLMPNEAYLPGAAPAVAPANPLMNMNPAPQASQQAMAAGVGAPLNPLPSQTVVNQDEETSVDDVVWINRTKKIIANTQGDPHRRVQLLQQLSVVYLKERYGRTVRTDDK